MQQKARQLNVFIHINAEHVRITLYVDKNITTLHFLILLQ